MNWWVSFKRCMHGRGHEPYTTREAKLAFADSLLKASDKLFFAPFVPLIALSFAEDSPRLFFLQLILSIIIFAGAACLRHEALSILDKIYDKNREESDT